MAELARSERLLSPEPGAYSPPKPKSQLTLWLWKQHPGRELPLRVQRTLDRAHLLNSLLPVQLAQQLLLEGATPDAVFGERRATHRHDAPRDVENGCFSTADVGEGAGQDVWVHIAVRDVAGVANDAELIVVDVSNPATPLWLGGYGSPTCSESITVDGDFAYLAHGDRGLEIFDISRTMPPPLVSHHDAAGKGRGIDVVGPLAYLANGYTGLQILDISDRASIREVGNLPIVLGAGVHVAGRYAYVANDFEGLLVIDVASAPAPTDVTAYDTPGYAYDVQVAGSLAYVADDPGGLRIIDLSDPEDVNEVGLYLPPDADILGVALAGPYAYVAAGKRGLVVLDIQDSQVPREVARVETPSTARTVRVAGSPVYVGALNWVRAIDISTPTVPREITSSKMPSYAEEISVSDGTAYVAAYDAGLLLLALDSRSADPHDGPASQAPSQASE